jgi:hypothetical protein
MDMEDLRWYELIVTSSNKTINPLQNDHQKLIDLVSIEYGIVSVNVSKAIFILAQNKRSVKNYVLPGVVS